MRRLLLVLVLAGCDIPILGPEFDYVNRQPMPEVPAEYSVWYERVRTCWLERTDEIAFPHLHARFSRFESIRWYVADDIRWDEQHSGGVIHGNEITMHRDWQTTGRVVRHEMSHHISGLGNGIHYNFGNRAICDEAA